MSIQLAGDVGGTKSALAIIDSELGPRDFLEKATYPSADYPSLDALVAEFLKGKKWQLARASIDVGCAGGGILERQEMAAGARQH